MDTTKVFPHPAGPSKCRSLRALAKEFLNREIQAKETGHDSKEDAIAALDLMKFKTEQMRIYIKVVEVLRQVEGQNAK